MYKQEALDSLECFRSNTAHILGDNDEKVKTIETCMMLVQEVGEASEWIPVRERLPEINKPVLVWVYDEYYLSELHSIGGVMYWDFDQFDLSGDEFDDVIAWMPLPEPYKEVKDEYSN